MAVPAFTVPMNEDDAPVVKAVPMFQTTREHKALLVSTTKLQTHTEAGLSK